MVRKLTMRPYISEELLTLGKISIGIPKYLKIKQIKHLFPGCMGCGRGRLYMTSHLANTFIQNHPKGYFYV